MSILEDYYSRADLAKELGVADRTIARYEALPEGLPSLMIGGRKLYPGAAVKAWLERRVHYPNTRAVETSRRIKRSGRYAR